MSTFVPAALDRLFGRFRPQTRGPELDEDIGLAIRSGDLNRLMSHLETRRRARSPMPAMGMMLPACQQAGWSQFQCDKLRIFHDYYHRADMANAAERAWRYLQTDNPDVDILIIAMTALNSCARFDEALQLLATADRQLSRLAGRWDFYLNAAVTCWTNGLLDRAGQYAGEALRIAPNNIEVLFNTYVIYFELDERNLLEELHHQLLAHAQDDRVAMVLATSTLAQDNYRIGFQRLDECLAKRNQRHFPAQCVRWTGDSLAGKTLLLLAEQGLGDTIQMVRYLDQVLDSRAERVLMTAPHLAISLLEFNYPSLVLVPTRSDGGFAASFDRWINTMSLPHLLAGTDGRIPKRSGYLRVPPENTQYWRDRVRALSAGHRPRIGLAWSGRREHQANPRRSVPFAQMMDAICRRDADFFTLQTVVPPGGPANLIDVSEELVTLSDTAALIAEMDLIVTVDTLIVHLAGALGHPTWLLLPYRYEWRWGLAGERNNWYESVRVIRQPSHGDWDSVLAAVFGDRFMAYDWHTRESR